MPKINRITMENTRLNNNNKNVGDTGSKWKIQDKKTRGTEKGREAVMARNVDVQLDSKGIKQKVTRKGKESIGGKKKEKTKELQT